MQKIEEIVEKYSTRRGPYNKVFNRNLNNHQKSDELKREYNNLKTNTHRSKMSVLKHIRRYGLNEKHFEKLEEKMKTADEQIKKYDEFINKITHPEV